MRAIEIVSRTGSLAPAAAELGVTVGAVSQHIRRAEARLGVDLFERTRAGLRPTPQLEVVRPLLNSGFTALLDAVRALQRPDQSVLTLTMGSVFASRWLVRRLPHFTAGHPQVELRLVATGRLVDLATSDIDCAIRYGAGSWPGTHAEPLGMRTYQPVAAPELAGRLKRPADLALVPVIEDMSSMMSWPDWFKAAGSAQVATGGPRYTDPALAFEAATTGQGVLMSIDRMSADAIKTGQLVAPFACSADGPNDYWFVTSAVRRTNKTVSLFRDWLMEEVAAT
ncbi:MAG: LysR substrate-binding domain-containing protein [Devosia sp.]